MQLAPHAPTPSTGRDNTSASCGFEAAVPGPLSVPGFLCLNCRKEALSSTRPQGPGEQEGVCFVCVHLSVLWECAEVFLLTEVTYIYLQGFSPLTLLYMNSGHGEGVERERAGENCNNFLLSFLPQLLNKFMMEGR